MRRCLSAREQRGWIRDRLTGEGFQPDEAAVMLLAERTEGNLLSARQQIDKLALAHDPGPLSVDAVMEAIADASRFDVFQLGSAALGQDLGRTARILAGLRRERAPLTLILWVLVRDITTLADLYWRTARGDSLPSAMGALRVWSSRKAEFRSALKRHGVRSIRGLLVRSAQGRPGHQGRPAGRAVDGAPVAGLRPGGAASHGCGSMSAWRDTALGLLGGSFDPVHKGHVALARQLADAAGLSEVRFVIAPAPPHRTALVASAPLRLRMLTAALEGIPGFSVEECELGPSATGYTVDTLEILRRANPGRTLCWMMGFDSFLTLPTWRRWQVDFRPGAPPGRSPRRPPGRAARRRSRRKSSRVR